MTKEQLDDIRALLAGNRPAYVGDYLSAAHDLLKEVDRLREVVSDLEDQRDGLNEQVDCLLSERA